MASLFAGAETPGWSRAIYLFATFVGLMDYCIEQELPHPGFLLIDSPINPFKGKKIKDTVLDDQMEDHEEEKIFLSLSKTPKSHQIILFENKEPARSMKGKINHIEFTGDQSDDLRGFL